MLDDEGGLAVRPSTAASRRKTSPPRAGRAEQKACNRIPSTTLTSGYDDSAPSENHRGHEHEPRRTCQHTCTTADNERGRRPSSTRLGAQARGGVRGAGS